MSPDKQRIAIAEACKWEVLDDHSAVVWERVICNDAIIKGSFYEESDPLTDLNAMHEAEKVLKDWNKYVCMVAKVIVGDTRPKASGNNYHVATSIIMSATAAQRAEAFLRTIGKWEDDK